MAKQIDSSGVSLYIRVRLKDGRRQYCLPAYSKNHRLEAGMAIVQGQREHHPEGVYALRYRRADGKWTWESCGQDPCLANIELSKWTPKEGPSATPETEDQGGARRLGTASDEWLAQTKVRKAKRTWILYSECITMLLQCCDRDRLLSTLSQRDLMAFEEHLKARGNGERTIHNRICQLRTFLTWANLDSLFQRTEDHPAYPMPTYTEKKVSAYREHELRAMLAVADSEERFLLEFLVGTGFREGEAMHAEFTDIDFVIPQIRVRDKPE